jgi:glycosyltransferase involved in cell wall biosynthesis
MNEQYVSIILPTYNRSNTLKRSIESVLKQSFSNFELIIIDDGSTDETTKVLRNYTVEKKIKLIKIPHSGCAFARNIGIKHAKGDLIAFQDSDDEWMPDKLEASINILSNCNSCIHVVYSDMITVDAKGNERYHYSPTIIKGKLFNDTSLDYQVMNIGIVSALIKKECFNKIGCFDESLPRYIDLDLFIRLSNEYHFFHYKEPLVKYHYSKNKITNNNSLKIIARKHLVKKYMPWFKQSPKHLSKQYSIIAQTYYSSGSYLLSLIYKIKAILALTRIIHHPPTASGEV